MILLCPVQGPWASSLHKVRASLQVTSYYRRCWSNYHTSDKIVGILLDRTRPHDSVKITVLGVEIRIGRLIEFDAGGEQSKMADDELVAMDLS